MDTGNEKVRLNMAAGNVVSVFSSWSEGIVGQEHNNVEPLRVTHSFRCGQDIRFHRFSATSRIFHDENVKVVEIPLPGSESTMNIFVPQNSSFENLSLETVFSSLETTNVKERNHVFPDLNVRFGAEIQNILSTLGFHDFFKQVSKATKALLKTEKSYKSPIKNLTQPNFRNFQP